MLDNRLLHDLAMERKARQLKMQENPRIDFVRKTEEEIRAPEEVYSMSEVSDDDIEESTKAIPDHEDLILSQPAARDMLESMMKFAEEAGLDKPSARTAMSQSLGDADR